MRNMVKQKGQGIVEYALLLAFIVGLAVMLNGSNLGGAVKGVFDDVAAVLGGGSDNKYAQGFSKWSGMKYSELSGVPNSERIAADLAGLTNIADHFNSLGLSFDQLAGTYNESDGYLQHKWPSDLDADKGAAAKGSVIFNYTGAGDREDYFSRTYYKGPADWMQGNNADYVVQGYSNHTWQAERYFFSDEMSDTREKTVRVSFTKDSSGNITGTRVWVNAGGNASTAMTATDENGKTTSYSVYVPKT